MYLDDEDDSWVDVQKFSDTNSNAAADAANSARQGGSLDGLRQATRYNFTSFHWFGLRTANAQMKAAISPRDVNRYALDHATSMKVEASLAGEDAEVNAPLPVRNAGSAEENEPEQYSASMTQALHTVFHNSTVLPCDCEREGGQFRLLDTHVCALRLDGKLGVSGDSSHCFFESVVAVDENYQWRHIQFQIPRYGRSDIDY
ncbi:uncharacterized protein BDZ99DRAFT_480922 [Mytilinidion resinicola]|uniref:Uncharacterized protein n=1 Tax=Mytilinidion resinicola TaxID=574789 RepID=A0A6A6Y7Y6_9PEZI|nr:uncharacterized protein BDZ99DRAFT_480922 [Mytilinidion resinicola]KAF2804922.1 hypothetical protein BDZ99DRAFT_480922 [Mytilinidion resinicola]